MDSEELARRIGLAWEKLPEPRHPFSLEIITPGPPVRLREPGPASAAAVAGRSGPRARPVAAATGELRLEDCIIAMWSAWPCAAWREIWKASAAPKCWTTWAKNFRSRAEAAGLTRRLPGRFR